ncbi:MAG TPA: AsmA-like C-terminal region-containing protein [Candidatus Saccharimonadaceae bacterium]|jgi:hypothetical protein|nr:AsmA-like C-terminal region-containing protein [Candidatus Saccharimonadaceae bacterium]
MTGGAQRRPLWIALGALVVVVGAAWVIVAVAFPPERVRALVEQQATQALHRPVRIESASFSLWPPVRFVLKGPALAEPGGFANGSAARAEALDLDVDPFALLGHRLVIRRLALDRPTVHLVLRADGTTNFDGLGGPPTPGASAQPTPGMDLAVRELSLKSASIVVDDVRAARRTAFNVDSRIGLEVAQGTRSGIFAATSGQTTLSGLARGPITARLAELDRRLADLRLTVDHKGNWSGQRRVLLLDRLALGLGNAKIAMTGAIDASGTRPVLNLHAKGDALDLAEILRALSAAELPALHGVSGAGRVDFNLTVNGALAPQRMPDVTGALRVQNGAFRYPGAPVGVSGLGFTARFAPDSLGIGDLAARVGDQPVKGSVTVTRFADPRLRFAVDGILDLAAIGPLVAPADTRLAGRAAVRASGEGRVKDPGSMALGGSARLADVSVKSPQLPQPMQHVSGDVAFTGARATVRGFHGEAGKSSFNLDATIDRPLAMMAKPNAVAPAGVDFTLNSPYLDLAELLPPTPGPALLPNVKGGGRVSIGRLKQGKLDVARVGANVTFDPTHLDAPSFALDGYGGRVSGNASFDLTNPASPGFKVKAKVDSVQADALLSAWTPAKNLLKGALSTTLDLSGAGTQPRDLARTLTAIGVAGLVNGEVGPAPALAAIAAMTRIKAFQKVSFQKLDLPFKIENGRVATRDVVLHGPSGDWKASGLVGFDGALDYVVSTTVPREQVARLGANAALAAGALADADGRVHLAFRVGGTAASPRVALDTQSLRDEAAGRVSQALEQQKNSIEQQLQKAAPNLLGGGDTTRGVPNTKALTDSLKKMKGSDILKNLFGGGKKKAAPPESTAHGSAGAK